MIFILPIFVWLAILLLNQNQFLIIIKSIILKYYNSYFILLDIDKNLFKEKIIPRLSTIDVDVQLWKLYGFTLSSVLVIIHFRDCEPKIILTKRSSLLKYHKNEI